MKTIAAMAAAAALLITSCASAPITPALAAAQAEAERIVRASEAPSAAVAVVADGRIVYARGFGSADPRTTAFRIGSASKLFTALALVRLAERGVVAPGDSVSRFIPAFDHEQVTLAQLARHLGGVRHYGPAEYINTTRYDGVSAALHEFIDDPLVAAPGEKYVYSSYGYNLLGAALERASGLPFEELVAREVLRPFRMRNTFARTAPRSAAFYGRNDARQITAAPEMDLSDRVPSGGYLSTASDLARFLIGVMRLPRETKERMFEAGQTAAGAPTRVGLGWRIAADAQGRRYVHHGGDTVGGRAFVLAYPDHGVGVVLLGNLTFAPLGEKDALALAQLFLDRPGAPAGE